MSWRRPGRRAALLLVIVISVASGAAGMLGAQWVRSPQDDAARRQAPAPSMMTAPVAYRVLVDNIVTRGEVVVGHRQDITLMGAGESSPVVTGVRVRTGQRVSSGQVVVEVSGRPVIVLRGTVPAYRDLRPGATGKDVSQLQAALAGLGYTWAGDTAGSFGVRTQSALRRFYASVGYDVPTTGSEADLATAADGVRQAERALSDARRSLARARTQQQQAPAHQEPAAATALSYAVHDAARTVRYSEEDLVLARQRSAAAAAASGPMLPLNEVAFVPELPASVSAVKTSVGAGIGGPALTLDLGLPHVTTTIDPQRRALLQVGMPVRVLLVGASSDVPATISRIGPEGDDGQGGLGNSVTITFPTPLARSAVGSNVRITATTASTKAKVLVVPLAAVSSSADGTTNVVVLSGSGAARTVPVRPGISASGYVAVTPLDPEALIAGDRVVVGIG